MDWRAPGFAQGDDHPVVGVTWNDAAEFCKWLSRHTGMTFRLPREIEWEYACRAGSTTVYWWGDELEDGQGRLNISAIDFLPGRKKTWPLAKAPWSDGFAFVSPVDHYGEEGRNGFGLADMCGGVWEIVLDHFDPQGAHEEAYFVDKDPHPVCRGGNYFDVPGNARCAVRLSYRPFVALRNCGFRVSAPIRSDALNSDSSGL